MGSDRGLNLPVPPGAEGTRKNPETQEFVLSKKERKQ